MPGTATVGQLVINMTADVASLKATLTEGNTAVKSSTDKMVADIKSIKEGFEQALLPLQNLTVKVGTLESNMAKAQSAAQSLAKGLVLGAAAGMSFDAIKKKIDGVIDSLATLKTVSEKTGSSVESLSKLSFAAKASGSDLDSVAGALAKMSKGMAGADDDTKGAGRALSFLGISAKDAEGNLKDPADMFLEIAKRLDGYKDGAGKAAIAQALFGKSGADMLPTLKLIGEQGDIVAKTTDAQATAARQYQRDLAKLDAQKGMLFKTIATALLPTMSDFTNAMIDASKNVNIANKAAKDLQSDGSITDWADAGAMGLARLIDVIVFIPKALKSVAGSFKAVGADIELAYTLSPQRLAAMVGEGKNVIEEIKKALAERNKVVDDANKNYVELWNYQGNAMEQAMAKRIAARKSGAAAAPASTKDELNYSTSSDDPAGKMNTASAIAAAQAGLESERLVFDSREKMLDLYHQKFGLSDDRFYAGRAAARQEYIDAEAVAFDKESAIMRAAISGAGDKESVAAAKDKYAQLEALHAKFLQEMSVAGGTDRLNEDADAKAKYDAEVKAINDTATAAIKALDEQIEKQKEHNAEIGKTPAQIELEKQAIQDKQTAQKQADADYLRDGLAMWDLDEKSRSTVSIKLDRLDQEIEKRKELARLLGVGSDAEVGAKAAADLDKYLNPEKAEKFGEALTKSLKGASQSIIDLTATMQKLGAQQTSNDQARALAETARKSGQKTEVQYLEALQEIDKRSTQQQLAGYGNMAAAAAGFFDEHSRGYQALTTVSQVFHAAELAMTLAEQAPKAINAILNQGAGDPYTAPVRMAAMAAIVAGLGVAIGGIGGGADTTAQDRQASQGAGTVLGSSSAKSDSISKSIALTASNSSMQINYLAGMEASLKNIESNISSFASLLVRTTDISNPDVNLNTNNGLGKTAMTAAVAGAGFAAGSMVTLVGSVLGPVGAVAGLLLAKIPVISNLLGKVGTAIFGGKQTLDDSGFTIGKSSLGSILSMGVNAQQYADVTTSGGWFSSDKHSTQTTSLGADANSQITKVITSLDASIVQAGALLGVTGDDFADKLNSFVVDIGKVSLKGLSGDDLQKALESVFSKLGDQMAAYAIGGLDQFQKVGEGYLETLTRVATDYAKVDASLQSIGKTFGATGVASIGARESLIALLGGIDDFQSKTSDYAQNFLTKAQQLAPVQAYVTAQLSAMNLGWVQTRTQFASVIQSLDLTNAAGQNTYAALMNLESAFAAVTPAIEDATKSAQDILDERKDLQDQLDQLTMTSAELLEKQRDALDASNRSLFDQVQVAQKAKDASDAAKTSLGNFITQMKGFATTAAGLNNSLLVGSLSTLTPEQQLAEARRQYELANTQAMAGDATAQGNLSSLEQTFLQLSQKLNGGDAAYSSDLATVLRNNDLLATTATKQANIAQASLDALNGIASTLTNIQLGIVKQVSATTGGMVRPTADTTTTARVAAAVRPVDYSTLGTSNTTSLVEEIRALRASNEAMASELKGLRADQQQQTGDMIGANAKAAQGVANQVVEGVNDAVTERAYAATNSERARK